MILSGDHSKPVRPMDDGRVVLFAWLMEGRTDAAIEEAGWAGVQSLPVELTLTEDLQLVSKPVEEISALRGEKYQLSDVNLPADSYFELPLHGTQLEIEVDFDAIQGPVGLCVLTSHDETELTCIGYDPGTGAAFIDTTRSSLDEAVVKGRHEERLSNEVRKPIKIRAFVDHSVLEVWFNDQVRISGRAYPTRDDADRVKLFAQGGAAHVRALTAWQMKGIWD